MEKQRENQPVQRVVTKIEGCETKSMSNGKYMSKLRDSNGNNYIVFHTKKDGNKTKAYSSLEQMPMSGIGQYAEIAYVEESYEREGQQYTSKKAIGIQPSKEETNSESNKSAEEGFLPVN